MARTALAAHSLAYVVLSMSLGLGCMANDGTGKVFPTGGDGGNGATGGGGSGGSGAGSTSGGMGGEGGSLIPPGDGGVIEPAVPAEVYGHSASTLYKLDPDTKEVTVVGPFTGGCSSVIDIAMDADANIIGTTFGGLYHIDKTNAKCTEIATGSYPNSLSYVPKGTLDPDVEALVGYQGSTYVRIDPVSGQISTIGQIGGGYTSSGDIVSVKDGGTYLTVTGSGCGDCLIQVDPKTGALVKNWGAVGYSSVYGIAYWAGSVYGFNDGGNLFEITFDQDTINTKAIPTMSGLSFWGAGSSTLAPVVPPPK